MLPSEPAAVTNEDAISPLTIKSPISPPLEIVVRTYEMRLRLRGTVLASHPGYGMGVAFELDTPEGQANLKKLIDFVATTTDPSA